MIPYAHKIEAAKQWLGDRYLLAHPINRRPKRGIWSPGTPYKGRRVVTINGVPWRVVQQICNAP
jgi:hypothetical protein